MDLSIPPTVPDVGDSAIVMARAIDFLLEVPSAAKIVFVQQRNYSYPYNQASMLSEISQIYEKLIKQEKVLVTNTLAPYACKRCLAQRYDAMRYLILTLLKQDPIACSNASTAFTPLFSPSNTGGSSPSNIKGCLRLRPD